MRRKGKEKEKQVPLAWLAQKAILLATTIKIDIPYFSCKPLSFLSPSLAYPLPP
jgi:hypothetical protein